MWLKALTYLYQLSIPENNEVRLRIFHQKLTQINQQNPLKSFLIFARKIFGQCPVGNQIKATIETLRWNDFCFIQSLQGIKQFRICIKSTAWRGCWTLHMHFTVFSFIIFVWKSTFNRIYTFRWGKIHLKWHANTISLSLDIFYRWNQMVSVHGSCFCRCHGIWKNDIVYFYIFFSFTFKNCLHFFSRKKKQFMLHEFILLQY